MKRVERLGGRDALPGYGQRVTEMASALFAGGLDPVVIAGFVARLNDTLLQRILRWAEADLGPPPCRFAWLAFGSEGRMEQLLLTDQDHALVYEDDTPEAKRYFQAVAEQVNADLVAAGFPRCPGGYMASSWHGPLSAWDERLPQGTAAPSLAGLVACLRAGEPHTSLLHVHDRFPDQDRKRYRPRPDIPCLPISS